MVEPPARPHNTPRAPTGRPSAPLHPVAQGRPRAPRPAPSASRLEALLPAVPWLLLFAFALLVRLVYLRHIQGNPFWDSPIIDAQTYDELAQAVSKGQLLQPEAFWQPPLYPYLLGLVYAFFGRSLILVRVGQAFLGALTVLLTGLLGRRLFGPRAGLLAGGLLALYGPLIFMGGELLVPNLSLPLDLAALLLLLPTAKTSARASGSDGCEAQPPENERYYRRDASRPAQTQVETKTCRERLEGSRLSMPPGRALAAGLLLGLSAVSRPTVLLFVASVGLWWAIRAWRSRASRLAKPPGELAAGVTWRRTLLPYMLGLVLPILPVSVHNLLASGEPILISSNGGVNLWLGNNPDYDGGLAIRPGIAWKQLMREPRAAGARTPATASAYWSAKAWRFVTDEPVRAFRLIVRKGWHLIQAWEIPRNLDYHFFAQHFAPGLTQTFSFSLIFPLAGLGLLLTLRRPGQALPRLYLLSTALGVVAFFVVARYRLSLLPVLACYAGAGGVGLIEALLARRWRLVLLSMSALAGLGLAIHWDPYQVARVDQAEGWNLVGKAHSNLARREEAVKAFRKAISLDPLDADILFNLGRELQLSDRCQEALAYYRQALRQFPDDMDTLNNLGICCLTLGHQAEGLKYLEKAAALYPEAADLQFNLRQARAGPSARPVPPAQRPSPPGPGVGSGSVSPSSPAGRSDTGNPSTGTAPTGSTSVPLASEAHALASGSNALDPVGLNNQAWALLSRGQAAEALPLLEAALARDPSYAVAWSNRAQCLYVLGRYPEAAEAFKQAVTLKPAFWKAWRGLAMTQAYGLKDLAGARAVLNHVARAAPPAEQAEAQRLLESLPPGP